MSKEYFNKKMEMYEQYVHEAFDAEFKVKSKARAEFFMIDVTELSDEVDSNPAVFDYIARLVAKATEMRNAAKIDEKVIRAKMRLQIKEEQPIAKMTVDDLSALVDSCPQVIQAVGEHIFAQNMLDDYQADKDAAYQKHEMLKMLAADLKREKMLKSGM
jgi:hypothetical protein